MIDTTSQTNSLPIVDIFDLMISNNQRYFLLKEKDAGAQFEIVKRLMDIYRLSKIKKLEKFFTHICIFDVGIDLYLKQELLYLLSSNKLKNKNIEKAFLNVLFLMAKKSLNSNEYWLMLLSNIKFFKEEFVDINIYSLLKNIIMLSFKYNKSFKNIFDLTGICKKDPYFVDLCTLIFNIGSNNLTVKNNLLLLQIIFKDDNPFQNNLFQIAQSDTIDLNLKLEACDILHSNGSPSIKSKSQFILQKVLPDMVYTSNPENAHLTSLVPSIEKSIHSIISLNEGKDLPQNLHIFLIKKFMNHVDAIKINSALNRIFNYNFLKFSKYELTLKQILEHIFLVVTGCQPELQNQLYKRLEEELIDMYDTCSQGYLTRLINIFSGFEVGTIGIAISYEDEIYSIFSNKINFLVSNAPEEIKSQLEEELMVPSDDYVNRLNLIRYLRPHIPIIWNEIFELYTPELTITDLDLYCRKITMRYEGLQ
ncbi:hypothetical protein WIV_gp095 [Wiseana iridescent virus]|uniref:Uncharacterized protein n=1 Tax=Wiseana iridescent virus TaxID=68347 RepID=G0T5C1_IRV9|nr:hypothetical protein WIV_gp095 [Wiseana iridescent virus]ADO00439.1 hypothetical protein [Wiseana iridescent virus]